MPEANLFALDEEDAAATVTPEISVSAKSLSVFYGAKQALPFD